MRTHESVRNKIKSWEFFLYIFSQITRNLWRFKILGFKLAFGFNNSKYNPKIWIKNVEFTGMKKSGLWDLLIWRIAYNQKNSLCKASDDAVFLLVVDVNDFHTCLDLKVLWWKWPYLHAFSHIMHKWAQKNLMICNNYTQTIYICKWEEPKHP